MILPFPLLAVRLPELEMLSPDKLIPDAADGVVLVKLRLLPIERTDDARDNAFSFDGDASESLSKL
jgi:hypothetical protein